MFFSKPSFHASLVVDIGSTSVGVAIVVNLLSKEGQFKPQVIFTHRETSFSAITPTSEKFTTSMLKLLDKALSVVEQQGLPLLKAKIKRSSFDAIKCVYASPWYISQNKKINLHYDKEMEFTPNLLNLIISNEIQQTKDIHPDLIAIDTKVTQVQLNGYETLSPFGKFANQVGATVYTSLLQSDICKKIEATIRKRINVPYISHHSFSFATYSIIRKVIPRESFIIVDIGGEVTDITTVKDYNLMHQVTFPLGKNFLLRGISQINNVELTLAHSAIKTNLSNTVANEYSQNIKDNLEVLKKEWITSFKSALTSLEHHFIPKHIFITCDNDVLPFFVEILTNKELSQELKVKTHFTVQPITADLFHSVIQITPGIREDMFLYLDVAFLDSQDSG